MANISFLTANGYQPTDSADGGPSPLRYSLLGFKNAGNTAHWHSVLRWVQFDFDPAQFLVRRINSEAPPKGKAQKLWTNCAQALTQLLQQQVQHDDAGTYIPDRLFDQLTMLTRCLPTLLLRVPPMADHDTKSSIVVRNCQRFLQGHWRSLATTAHEELTVCNILATRPRDQQSPTPPPTEASKHQHVLARARALHYSKAMNLLRSPGLATQSHEEVTAALASLHPSEPVIDMTTLSQPGSPITLTSFNFIDGRWLTRLIRKSSAGTAVDQWGWDSKEMWQPFTHDKDLMNLIAECWVRPMAAGYLPHQYREHLAGGRLIALSKYPKPGVRPICISDAIRRILGRGLLQHARVHFTAYFQNSSPNVIQYGGSIANGASYMYHLLSAVNAQAEKNQQHCYASHASHSEDPLVILPMDSKNAFNALNRQQLVHFLQEGCETHAPNLSPSNGEGSTDDPSPYGWDALWPYFAAHYGCHGSLKYYSSGTTSVVKSQSGVQQGDPLGSTLFALGIHPILLNLGHHHPRILVSAYADNVVLAGPLSAVEAAHADYCSSMQAVGLTLNPRESHMYIPEWRGLQLDQIQSRYPQLRMVAEPGSAEYNFWMPNGDCLPLHREGLNLLGCPIGSSQYSSVHLSRIVADIQKDLDALMAFPSLHQRTKLALYCCNTRITYLQRAVPLALSLPLMPDFDERFDQFMAKTLSFEDQYQSSLHSASYQRALRQIRLGIKQGGFGLTSGLLTAPVASYVALREFRQWYNQYAQLWGAEAVHFFPWLQDPNAGEPCAASRAFPHIVEAFEHAVAHLHSEWNVQGDLQDQRDQNTISTLMKEHNCSQFSLDCSLDDAIRLSSVAAQSIPMRCSSSDLCPNLQSNESSLEQCPMTIFELQCPLELSDQAFKTSMSICLGVPVPHARFLQATVPDYAQIDVWGDFLLNNSTHASRSRHSSHERLAYCLARLATKAGLPSSARPSAVPCAEDDSFRRGDIVTSVAGLNVASASYSFASPTDLITDVTLVHPFTSHHQLKDDSLADAEARKNRAYKADYHAHGFAFAPLACNSFGQQGPDLLRYLWLIADRHAQRTCSGLVPSSVFPVSEVHCSASASVSAFKACRARLYRQSVHEVLIAIYEAVTERVLGRTYALQAYPEYRAFFLALPTSRPGLLPSWPLPIHGPPLSSSSLSSSSPSPSSSPSLACASA